MITRGLSTVCVIVGFLIAAFSGIGPGAARADGDSRGLVGAWVVSVCAGSSDPCPVTAPSVNLVTFGKDGNVIVADYAVPSAGLGVWKKTRPDRFAVTYVLLLSDGQGTLQGRIKVRATLRLNPVSDTWDGPFRADITDPTGQYVVDFFEGTAHGTRMQVEALP